jgi:hypothetical protein
MRVNPGLRGLERKLSHVPAQAGLEPARLPSPGLSITLAVAGVNLQVFLALAISLRMLDFDFDARLLVMSQRQLTGQPARDWSRPTSKGQFPFPLAPEFWDSWNDSWLETSLSAYGTNAERGSSSFEPL